MSINKNNKVNKSESITIEEQYKKKTLHQHILDLPDSYIGSIQNDLINIYVYDEKENKILKKDKHIVLGLYKIFDEVIVNAADNTVRDKKCNKIEVTIDKNSGEISVWNNGSTIPIEIHKDYNIYVPELIFGNLLTSGNYDQKGKTVGGKNGFGSKCISPCTLIPLFSGKIKKASDITLNDKLVGDDGKIRNIKNIIKGTGLMYEITQENGKSYKVNDQHILTLKFIDHKKIFWSNNENSWVILWWNNKNKCIDRKSIKLKNNPFNFSNNNSTNKRTFSEFSNITTNNNDNLISNMSNIFNIYNRCEIYKQLKEFSNEISDVNIFDINIQDYMNLDFNTKNRLTGIRGECIQWEKQIIDIDPYIIGLWLGLDNTKNLNNPEIINYLSEEEEINNSNNILNNNTNFNFLKYNIINRKKIPKEYIINDKNIRLKLLAGIIDSFGINETKFYNEFNNENENNNEIILKLPNTIENTNLLDDIILLIRSLGYYCKNNTLIFNEYYIKIDCNIEEIPTKLFKKSIENFNKSIENFNKSTGLIKIKNIGIGDYIGFEIDSNQRFVLEDFTITHNCANIYSTRFDVEIVDPIRKKKYFQRFTNNMFNKEEPIITSIDKNAESYTKITFVPDYKKFGLKNLTDDMESLLKRRVYDIAGTTNSNVNVWLNKTHINIKSFKDYIGMFNYDDVNSDLIYEQFNERWTIGVIYDPNVGFQHMTFVNTISTFQGGTHLNYITNQIVDKITEYIISQPKNKTLKIKPHQIKENLTIFINSVIEDPSFNSQSKEVLTTKSSLFNIKCDLDDKFIGKLCKTGLINEIIQTAQIKQFEELEKSDGKKNINLKSLTKLDDARFAGTKRSSDCRLILTEGDSAKSFAISGLEIIGRDFYGVFPLKGKLLNARNATTSKLLSNEEIKNLKQIMGLKQNIVYTDTKKLRYGGIIILTDQDTDGSHIKGLLINFFHFFWPSLLKINGFIQSIATPIIKIYKNIDIKKENPEIFYTISEYKKWCELNNDNLKKYKIKYYKGLGTSTTIEQKESFVDFNNKIINYIWDIDNLLKDNTFDNLSDNLSKDNQTLVSDESIDKNDKSYKAIILAFAKQKENDRKEWVRNYDENLIIENNIKNIPIYDFINKDFIHFSHYDNIRSLPDLIDGLKPSQRKILYGAFKRKLDNEEIKVAQFSGYISEHSGYHHGEASLQGAIINMAQDFCGSNNINLLFPSGQFGTRRLGGNDSSSARYISTKLSNLTRHIFINKDEPILNYIVEDGEIVEPLRYYPIIPMLLVNGSEGIGTGFSTNIPPFNPLDLIYNIRQYLSGTNVDKLKELTPWYSGFTGRIDKSFDTKNKLKYTSYGKYEQIDEYSLRITELPVGIWTQNYIDFLSKLLDDDGILSDYENNCGTHKIDFKLYFKNGELQKLLKSKSIEEKLKLSSSIQISNMHVRHNNNIQKYYNPNYILKDYIEVRLEFYDKRKLHYIKVLENELKLLSYRRKFIKQVITNKLIISRKQKTTLIEELKILEYPELSTDINLKPSYEYLVGLPLWSLTQEKIDKLESDYNEKNNELNIYMNKTSRDLWIEELDIFENLYLKWYEEKILLMTDNITKKTKSKSKSKSNNKIIDTSNKKDSKNKIK